MKKRNKNILKWSFGIIILLGLLALGLFYFTFFNKNIKGEIKENFLYIPSNSSFNDVVEILNNNGLLEDKESFIRAAKILEYPENVKAGKYKIEQGMDNLSLIRMLKAGRQTPVKLVLRAMHDKESLSGFIGKNLEIDSVEFYEFLNDDETLKEFGLDSESSLIMFLPDTYEFYWNTDLKTFTERMFSYYNKFWDAEKKTQAEKIGLNIDEVSILASIVDKETSKTDEMARIAGVYLNRIKKGMKLQADPTVIFAIGNKNIRRVLYEHLSFDSPYNTYKYEGLPPGPICLPSKQAINAVLNAENHKYIFFCAKEDFSGYHNFAEDDITHAANSRKYRKALDARGIR